MYSDNPYGYNETQPGNHDDVYQEHYPYYDETDSNRQLFPWLPSFGGGNSIGPGVPPAAPPPGVSPQAGPPTGPPPGFTPAQAQQAQTLAVDPGSIQGCLFRYTYVWLRGFQQFWFYPTFIGRRSISGYRWNGFQWVYFGINLRQIQSFTCF